jgi:hypothetical protein
MTSFYLDIDQNLKLKEKSKGFYVVVYLPLKAKVK